MIEKICRNCQKYPCIKDNPMMSEDKCSYFEDFSFKENLVIKQPITFLISRGEGKKEDDRYFILYADRNNPLHVWMDNDEGNMLFPETIMPKGWYLNQKHRIKFSKDLSGRIIGYLNPECYPNIKPDFVEKTVLTVLDQNFIPQITETEKERKKQNKSKEEKLDINQVMQYPDWGLDGKIVNPIVLDKDVKGDRKIYTFKVYIDEDGKLQIEQIGARLFIPPTGMTPSALEADDTPLPVIYSKFKALMDRHLYFTNDIQYNLQTLTAMSSYFREVFDTYPYIDYFSADIGVGKTHAMLCLIFASFHGFAMVIPTEAVLFRSVEDAHATVGIDEVHKLFKNPGQHQDLLALLLSGHTKGIGTYRMDMNTKPPMLISYDPFGLKAFTRKGAIPIDLLSRSITFQMMNARKRKSVEEHLTPEEFAECRDMMYLYRLKLWQKVKEVYDALRNEKVLEGRQADLFLPLLTIAKLCADELYTKVLEYAREDEKKRFAIKHDEGVVVLVEYLKDEKYSGDVKVRDIRVGLQERLLDAGLMKEDRKLTSQTVMGWLSSLGFDKSRKRTDGYAHYTIDTKILDAWYEDIVIEKEGEENKPTPPIQQTSLSSLNLIQEEILVSSSKNQEMRLGEVGEVSKSVGIEEIKESEKIKILSDSDGWCEFCCESRASKKIEVDNEIRHVCSKCLAELNYQTSVKSLSKTDGGEIEMKKEKENTIERNRTAMNSSKVTPPQGVKETQYEKGAE